MIYALIVLSVVIIFTYKLGILDLPGSITAFFMGFLFWYFGGVNYILIVILFMGIGWLVTRYKNDYKAEILPESSSQREMANVIANGLSPLIFTLLGSPIAFFSSVSAALSDTMASELGILSEDAYLLTSMKKVKPGVNGAISIKGTLFSFLGTGLIVVPHFYLYGSFVSSTIVFVSGYLGCLIDSFLGCTLERQGSLSNFHVNLIATFSGGLISILLVYLL